VAQRRPEAHCDTHTRFACPQPYQASYSLTESLYKNASRSKGWRFDAANGIVRASAGDTVK